MTDSSSDSTAFVHPTERALVDAAWAQVERFADGSHPAAETSQGLSIPGYRILGEVHRGGQGVVYQAIQESTRRKVAVKVLKAGPFADATEFARFDREVDILSRINHPHIVAIHDRGLTAGHAWYVMDYIPGRPLDAYVSGADLPVVEVLRLFAKVCDAVNVAHLRGVIHRDLKPGNIRIDPEGEPRILDFGLAKLAQESGTSSSADAMTLTGQFIGSLPWASPEQAEGRSDQIDVRSDVYSLGVVLYQLVTGQFPYPVSGQINDVARHIAQTSPTRPSTIQRGLDHDVETIVLKCLAKQPERRYQSAGELARDIRHYLAGEPIEAKRDSFIYVLRKHLSRHRGAAAAAIAFVAMLIGSLAYCATQWQRASAEAIRADGEAQKATKQAQAADAARAEAEDRRKESQQIADFQSGVLGEIEVAKIGEQLRIDLLSAVGPVDSDESKARREQLESGLAGINLTNVALKQLDASIFRRAIKTVEEKFENQPLVQGQLYQALADTLHRLGLLDRATLPQEQALVIRRRELGDEHPDTLLSINQMGFLLKAQGKLPEAESYYREALDARRRLMGDEHPDTLDLINNMGVLLKAQGKLTEAEQYYREALDAKRRVLGDEHPDTLTSIHNMGALLCAQGKLSGAESFCREAMEARRRVLGDEDPVTLMSISNMASLLQVQGRLAEAEQYCREVLEKMRRVHGDEHPHTATATNNLASLLRSQGKLAEAERYFREAMEKRRRLPGDAHPDMLSSMNNLGLVLKDQGKLAAAEPYLVEALEKRRRVLGDEHPDTLASINEMGSLLEEQGKLAEAESLRREALERFGRALGAEHSQTLIAMNNMGYVLKRQGRLAAAEPYLREALAKSRHLLGDAHPYTLHFMNNMGELLQDQGRAVEAEQYVREALENRRRVLGDEHPDTLTSINDMGLLLDSQGRSAEAEPYCREALEKRRRVLGDEHSATLVSMSNLGTVLVARGKAADAEPYLRRVLEKRRRVLGDDHPQTLSSMDNIGVVLLYQGRLEEAEPYFREALEKKRRVLGEDHPQTLVATNNLGALLYHQNKLAEAEPYFREVLEANRRALGTDHQQTLTSVQNLGGLLLAQKKPAEAAAVLAPVERSVRRVFTEGNVSGLGQFLSVLGRSRAAAGEFDAAEASLVESHAILADAQGAQPKDLTTVRNGLIELYEARHAAEPDKGYDGKAAEWRAKLDAVKASTQPSTVRATP